jgi:alkyl sulfatase BDS1-like metallo-beta-lactamase superfamily hydrolase
MNTSRCLSRRAFRGALLAVMTFGVGAAHPAAGQEPKPAEPAVRAANHAVLSQLPFTNRDGYQDAARGFIQQFLTGS